jgi:hypothetical protein
LVKEECGGRSLALLVRVTAAASANPSAEVRIRPSARLAARRHRLAASDRACRSQPPDPREHRGDERREDDEEPLEVPGSIGIGTISIIEALKRGGRGYFTQGFTREELAPDLQELADDDRFFMPALRDSSRLQLRAMSVDELEQLVGGLRRPELEPSLHQAFELGVFTDEEAREELVRRAPGIEELLAAWSDSMLQNMTLTSVGLAIGHGYWRRVTGGTAPLSIWISD